MNSELKKYQNECKKFVAEELGPKRRKIIHVRKTNGTIVGTLIAVVENGDVLVGWSKCNKADKFNRSVGIVKAYKRRQPLEKIKSVCEKTQFATPTEFFDCLDGRNALPHIIYKNLGEFVKRAEVLRTPKVNAGAN